MVSFIVGFVASISTKGSKRHKQYGKYFAIALGISAIVALILSSLKPNSFLFVIGCFTLYLIASGWVWTWKAPLSRKIGLAKVIGIFGVLLAVTMLFLGVLAIHGSGILLLIFGGILLSFALFDISREPKGLAIYARHGGRMGGAFIASITAFAVTNVQAYTAAFLPEITWWLLPTIVGSPLIFLSIRKFKAGRTTG